MSADAGFSFQAFARARVSRSGRSIRVRRAALALLLALASGPAPGQEEPDYVEKEADSSFFSKFLDDPSLDGKLHLTYRVNYQAKLFDFKGYRFNFQPVTDDDREQARQLGRWRDDDSDQDVDQYVSLRTEDLFIPWEDSGVLQSFKTETAFRYFKDIDGSPPGEEARGGFDRFSGRQAFQLYKMFARVETFSRHLELTLGRQYSTEAEWVHFDGAAARFRGLQILGREVELTGFGGARVKFYSRSSVSHDGVGGGSIRVALGEETQLKLSDVYYLRNTFEAELRQGLRDIGWLAVRYRQIGTNAQSVTFDAHADWRSQSLTVDARYIAKVGDALDDFYFDFTESSRRRGRSQVERHFNIGGVEPYDELFLEARKGFLEHYGIFAGGIAHLLRRGSVEDNYNTDWYEVWAGLDVLHAPWKGLTGRMTVRYVDTDLPRRIVIPDENDLIDGIPNFQPEDAVGDGEPGSLGFEFLLEQDFERLITVGAQAVVRSYDYRSQFARVEDMNATSLGVHARWRPTTRTQWYLAYSYDRDYEFVNPDLEALHTIRLQFQYRW